jgi:predicted transglutaminase-like protease
MMKMHKTLRKKIVNGRMTNALKQNSTNKKINVKRAEAKIRSRKNPLEENVNFKMSYRRANTLINKLIKAKRIRDKLEQLASQHEG